MFHESSSLWPLIILVAPFRNVRKLIKLTTETNFRKVSMTLMANKDNNIRLPTPSIAHLVNFLSTCINCYPIESKQIMEKLSVQIYFPFATGVTHPELRISSRILEKYLKWLYWYNQGSGGSLFMKKYDVKKLMTPSLSANLSISCNSWSHSSEKRVPTLSFR
jgi:hypothetical protein